MVLASEAVVPRPCPPMEEFLDGPGGEDGDSDDAEDDGLEESKRMEKVSSILILRLSKNTLPFYSQIELMES